MCKVVQNSAKQSIPRGQRKSYISTWEQESQKRYNEFVNAQSPTEADCKASDLINHLNHNRRQRWEEAVESIDFSLSSRLAWQTFQQTHRALQQTEKMSCFPQRHCTPIAL